MDSLYASLSLVSIYALYALYKRYTRISISDIPGPKPSSFMLGNMPELMLSECGVTESKWQAEFGNVVRVKASFGEDRLWISDPLALQHILQTSGYSYPKPPGILILASMFLDTGIVTTDGHVNKRQRRVITPAFRLAECKAFVPMFQEVVGKVKKQWHDAIAKEGKGKVMDLPEYLSKATLDTIGKAAFGHEFGATENSGDTLAEAYSNIMTEAWGTPTPVQMFVRNICNQIPPWLFNKICEYAPDPSLKRMRENRIQVHEAAHFLLEKKEKEIADGTAADDLLGLIVKASMSDDAKAKLYKHEVFPQIRSVLLAGHETTATSISWTLYELAKHPEFQDKMRQEIWETLEKIHARGDADFQASDFESMTYTNAVINEIFRYQSVKVDMERIVGNDDVIPLMTPITTTSGKVLDRIPVAKGTILILSVAGYNMLKEVWGDDAMDFNPGRWLIPKKKNIPTLGVYGNLLTFSAGVRGCIGWRFALIEMQTFLTSLISEFQFSLPANPPKIRRERALFMIPTVDGELHMPLTVTPICRDQN